MVDSILNFLKDFGIWGMMFHSFIDAIIFPIPAFFTQISLSMVDPSNALWLATVGFIGCLLGSPIGYWIGKVAGRSFLNKILKKEWVDSASEMFNKHGEAAIFLGSFTPIPFKIFTILSGSTNFPLWKLMGYAAIGRAAKFYIVGILFYIYGSLAENVINEYFTLISFVLFLVIALVWFLFRKFRAKKKAQINVSSETK
ncbi:VTT domain-containing protein [Paenibacillus sp. SC116]|uniref:YqaA family protein n=1 Tax=Paenibacillus sp. SC116 TaxID=2968986 RepID=UPI00215B5535|nr:VTT domain-containing protein [Paenibacillus sp. SC116]MCR8842736.1 VTT domain-containing protein [Paenibacillus sp. SC116]